MKMRKSMMKNEFEAWKRADIRGGLAEMVALEIIKHEDTRTEIVDMLFSIVDRLIAVHGIEKLREKIEIT
jgi:c-di-GMP-related signal transduction protein